MLFVIVSNLRTILDLDMGSSPGARPGINSANYMKNTTTDMARSVLSPQRSALVSLHQYLFLALALSALTGMVQDARAAMPAPGDPTTQWIAIPYPTNIVSDYITDQQTGPKESDTRGTT